MTGVMKKKNSKGSLWIREVNINFMEYSGIGNKMIFVKIKCGKFIHFHLFYFFNVSLNFIKITYCDAKWINFVLINVIVE